MLNTMVRPSQASLVRTGPAGSERQVTPSGTQALSLVERWMSAWSDRDLAAILDCYRDDVELRSPFVRRIDDADVGLLHGKEAVGEYFASALERFPDLSLDVRDIVVGSGRVTVYYLGVSNLLSIETMFIDDDARVWRVDVQYRSQGPSGR